MVAKILNGKLIAKQIMNNFHREFLEKLSQHGNMIFRPKLVIYLINNSKASQIYINQKVKLAEKLNIDVIVKKFDEKVCENEIIDSIEKENNDKRVNSVIVQLPLLEKLNENECKTRILDSIIPIKDVDGLTSYNREKLKNGDFDLTYIPPTVLGVISLIRSQQNISGNRVAIIGHGPTLGYPSSIFLKKIKNEIVDIYEDTKNPEKLCSTCDIILSASGKYNHVTTLYIKDNCGIIDGGVFDYKKNVINSSIDMESVIKKAKWISPSSGGLGPLTVCWLFYNVFLSYFKQHEMEYPTFYQMQYRLESLLKFLK